MPLFDESESALEDQLINGGGGGGGIGSPVPTPTPTPTPTPIPGPTSIADPNLTPSPDPTGPIDQGGVPVPSVSGDIATQPIDPSGTTIPDLYPEAPVAEGPIAPTVATPTGAGVTETDPSVTQVGTPGTALADPSGAISEAAGVVGEQTGLTSEQQVDAELARILGTDSPLMAQARARAAQMANRRGLQNTSMAAGMAEREMVAAALPMAQQNAAQAAAREAANTAMRQQAGIFTASEQNRLNALEAELGTSVSVFNAEQLNQAESLAAQMRTALEQQDAQAYNTASLQLAELQRNAEAQQSQLDFAASSQQAAEQQAYNQQVLDAVTRINEQYLRGSQAMDLATIQGTYQQIISTNATAGSLYQSYFSGISSVMANPDMTPQQIATSVESMQRMLEASLRMIAEMNDMDFGDVNATIPGGAGPGGGGIPVPGPVPGPGGGGGGMTVP